MGTGTGGSGGWTDGFCGGIGFGAILGGVILGACITGAIMTGAAITGAWSTGLTNSGDASSVAEGVATSSSNSTCKITSINILQCTRQDSRELTESRYKYNEQTLEDTF